MISKSLKNRCRRTYREFPGYVARGIIIRRSPVRFRPPLPPIPPPPQPFRRFGKASSASALASMGKKLWDDAIAYVKNNPLWPTP
jgi:hypothetical protein